MEPLALLIRARFVPLRARLDCSSGWCIPCIPGGRFSAVLLAMDGRPVLFVPAAGAGCRIGLRHHFEAATEAVTGCASPAAGWKTGTAPWRATLRADLDAARAAASCRKGFPVSPCQGLDLVEPVMYLSWTGDVPVVHPPYTCATGKRPGCLTLMGVHVRGPTQPIAPYRAINYSAEVSL